MDHRIAHTLVGLVLCLETNALGQVPRADLSLAWSEVVTGTNTPVNNPNGVLEPGESARLSMSLSFNPGVGAPVLYQGGTALVSGFRRVGFNVVTPNFAEGTWSLLGGATGFAPSATVTPSNTIGFASIQQPFPTPGGSPISANPLPDLWHILWTPSFFEAREATFRLNGVSDDGTVLFVSTGVDPQGNPTFGLTGQGPATFGSTVSVPIAPTPGGLAFIGGTVLLGLQGRSRSPRR